MLLAAMGTTLPAQIFPPDLNRRGAAVERLHVWVEAARQHHPRVLDEGAERVAGWTLAALDDISIDLLSLLKLMAAPQTRSFVVFIGSPGRDTRRTVVYTGSELASLRALARSLGGRDPDQPVVADDDERIAAAQNRILKLGAAMHTTIGLAHAVAVETRSAGPLPRQGWLVRFADGRQVSAGRAADHWRFTRMLLGRVTPAPSEDAAVRTWYRASSAALLSTLQLHEAHFEDALDLFPDDPVLLGLTGSFHEALASPLVQAFVRASSLPTGVTLPVGSVRAELGQAESFFRRALAAERAAAEPRLRLGRVLSLEGRYADALVELEQVDASASTVLQYYRSLFVGDAAQSLGRLDDARTAYERSAALYPKAPTPWTALSHLAASAGDPTRAAALLDRAITEDADSSRADDPFWSYLVSPGRDADARLDEAYRALMAEVP